MLRVDRKPFKSKQPGLTQWLILQVTTDKLRNPFEKNK